MTMRLVFARPVLHCAVCSGVLFALTPNRKMDGLYQCLTPSCERNTEVLELPAMQLVGKVVEDPGIDPLATGGN